MLLLLWEAPISHFDTACAEILSDTANCSCVRFLDLRNSRILFPRFIVHLPFLVISEAPSVALLYHSQYIKSNIPLLRFFNYRLAWLHFCIHIRIQCIIANYVDIRKNSWQKNLAFPAVHNRCGRKEKDSAAQPKGAGAS